MGAQNCKFYFRTLKSISEGTRPIFAQNEETNLIFPPDPLHFSAGSLLEMKKGSDYDSHQSNVLNQIEINQLASFRHRNYQNHLHSYRILIKREITI